MLMFIYYKKITRCLFKSLKTSMPWGRCLRQS